MDDIVSVDLALMEDATYLPCLFTEQGDSRRVLPKVQWEA
jgi:hypothetical protein